MRKITIRALKAYQYFISPLFPPSCRFWPNCSAYAVEAVEKHGALGGLWLSTKRVARCNPLHPGGVDNVPDAQPRNT